VLERDLQSRVFQTFWTLAIDLILGSLIGSMHFLTNR
jgi:hypothetical protein